MNSQRYPRTIKFLFFAIYGLVSSSAVIAAISTSPLFLSQSTKPQVMFTMSNDHQLFYKAYDDYSDLDGDGTPEITYTHSVDYYGYFDSFKCYIYDTANGLFEPSSITANKYCSGANEWSGNFLNWATMSRIDTIRSILYGGYRSTDSASLTVLERTLLPHDAHSFAKYYNGSDLGDLTPATASITEISMCNTTESSSSSAYSQNVTDPPLLKIAKGNFSLWASNERWQCRWREQRNATNSNNPATSGLSAQQRNPYRSSDKWHELNVRVEVCNSSLIGQEKCKRYPSGNYKPIGLLQEYGDEGAIEYGLMTGSYAKNKSGGTLRKNIGDMSDEINVGTDGTFKSAPAAGNIVNTIDKLRLFGYYYGDGQYSRSNSDGDNCPYNMSSFTDGRCSNWGNPQAEIFLEALRYFAGKSANFAANDSAKHINIPSATWVDPLSPANWCAPLNIINFNASSISYDGDQLSGTSDIGAGSAASLTNAIGVSESITGKKYFVGDNGSNTNQLCTAKTVTNLADVEGTCPDSPRLEGTYHIAGLAHYARTNSIRTDLGTNEQTVMTYGVSLSPGTPQLTIPSPDGNNSVVLLPACYNNLVGGNCALVDFKIVQNYTETTPGVTAQGKVYVNWENSEQGSDYDTDMWGTISYSINNSTITVTTYVATASTSSDMGFGYVTGGTTHDGFHAHSGIRDFDWTDSHAGVIGCNNCRAGNAATSETYSFNSSSNAPTLLEPPLYYAAKWGGFEEERGEENLTLDKTSEWDANSDGTPDKYYYATNPSELASSLSTAFASVAAAKSSAASIVADSVTLETGTHIYQAQFDSGDWSGTIKAFPLNLDATIGTATWDAQVQVNGQNFDSGRTILSHDGTDGVAFRWANLTTAQQDLLNDDPVTAAVDDDGLGDERLNYIRGDYSNELKYGVGSFRNRDYRLGDLISSTPSYVGQPSSFYPDDFVVANATGTDISIYNNFKNTINALNSGAGRKRMLYAGANDGMLHGFDADTGNEQIAYIPRNVISKLPELTRINYAHNYYVDGSPTAADTYEAFPGCTTGSCWRTVLVGGLNGGGKGYYALDVTNPDKFSETDPTDHVLWEIDNTTTGFDDLGYTFGTPSIVKLHNGEWAAIVPNGYESADGNAYLYLINIRTGALIKALEADASDSGSNGLSTAAPVDIDGDNVADYVYAGDLHGNMWKFDLTDTNTNQWKSAFTGTGNTPLPLFTSLGTTQPITSAPDISRHPDSSGYMVFFGTGQYYETNDNVVPAGWIDQSLYAVWDKDDGTDELNRSNLTAQSIIYEATETFGTNSSNIRVTSSNPVDWSSVHGWYLDLDTQNGERIVTDPILHKGRIIFNTLIPSTHACDYGGTSWLMEVNADDGNRLDISPFDLDNDGTFTDADYVLIDIDGDGIKEKVPVSGKKSTVGITQNPTIIQTGSDDGKEFKISSGSKDAQIDVITESSGPDNETGRTSWRQLR